MHRQRLAALRADTADAGIVPDIGAIASRLAQTETVGVGGGPDLEDKDQFMFGPVEGSHAAIGLVPDAEVLEFGKSGFARLAHFAEMTPVHTDEGDGAVATHAGGVGQGRCQKLRKLGAGHFARGHGEFAMADTAKPGDVAVDGDVVGRIGEDQIGALAAHQRFEILFLAGVAADQPMSSQDPEIAGAADGPRWGRRQIVERVRGLGGALALLVDHEIDFGEREAGEGEIEADIAERQQLVGEDVEIPAGVEGELVVGDDIGADFLGGEVGEAQGWHAFHPELLCGHDAAVSGDDGAVVRNEDGVGEAKASDAVGDLADLRAGMPAGVFIVGLEGADRTKLDLGRGGGGRHR